MSYFKIIDQGTVTSPRGFLAGTIHIGLKTSDGNPPDLCILFSTVPCTAAGVFTSNKIKAAPVVISQRRIENRRAQAIVVNSGCANACTGEQGMADAEETTSLAAAKLNLSPDDVLVASTGMIGVPLAMGKIRNGIGNVQLSSESGHDMARAIMTTDTFPKEMALMSGKGHNATTIGGIAKGSGMIHPNLATMLCFLTTDAAVDPGFLERSLRKAVANSFNMITVDGDTSTNDTVIILANGLAGNATLDSGKPGSDDFENALEQACIYLARQLARDGEGASKLIEVTVAGALTSDEARRGARTVAGSPLVKSAVHGSDPNWGRIIAALGRSGVEMEEFQTDLFIGDVCILRAGAVQPFDNQQVRRLLDKTEVYINVTLHLGKASATAWGCDLSQEYVSINSEYST